MGTDYGIPDGNPFKNGGAFTSQSSDLWLQVTVIVFNIVRPRSARPDGYYGRMVWCGVLSAEAFIFILPSMGASGSQNWVLSTLQKKLSNIWYIGALRYYAGPREALRLAGAIQKK